VRGKYLHGAKPRSQSAGLRSVENIPHTFCAAGKVTESSYRLCRRWRRREEPQNLKAETNSKHRARMAGGAARNHMDVENRCRL